MGKNSSHLREKERKKMPKENKGLFQNQKEAMGVKLEDSATRGQGGLADEGVSLGRCQERARRALKKMTRGTHARLGPGDSSPLTHSYFSLTLGVLGNLCRTAHGHFPGSLLCGLEMLK